MSRTQLHVDVNKEMLKRFHRVCRAEGTDASKKIRELLREYLAAHEHGNPQRRLMDEPSTGPQIAEETGATYILSGSPAAQRAKIIACLYLTIEANPGVHMNLLVAKASAAFKRSPEKIREYLKELSNQGRIRNVYYRLYPR